MMSVQSLKNEPTSNEEWEACREIIDLLNAGKIRTKKQLEHHKHLVCAKHGLKQVMSNTVILQATKKYPIINPTARKILIKKPARTTSGIAIVAVMTPPENSCPWDCYYCPSAENAPRSYTGREPSTMRSKQLGYDPYKVVRARITQLRKMGHPANKVHIVIQGGTFLARPQKEQEKFMIGILDGISAETFPDSRSKTLDEAIRRCELSKTKNVGITFETRPDVCKERHVDRMLSMGGTWVEIGVQTLSDEVLRKVNRGHDVAASIQAIRIAKDAAFKVTIHMMPNLFTTPDEDVAMFDELFKNPDFRPDALKIYPTLTMPGTKLHEMWKSREYVPYSEEELIETLIRIKSRLPPWVRIQRIQRDIPVQLIQDGIQHGNIRELIAREMKSRNLKCRCIRCREIGHQILKNGYQPLKEYPELVVREYSASEGKEFFISFEDTKNDVIYGFVRLRLPSTHVHRPEMLNEPTALIREVHVYGQEIAVGDEPLTKEAWQHRGLGKQLIARAEEIARDHGHEHVLVISAIGTRDYYRKLGYDKEGPYMGKKLD